MCCADWAPIQEISVSKSKKSEKVVSLIAAVIDESGSMAGVRTDTIGGYNTFIEKIRDEQAGKKAYVSTFLFDSSHTRPLVRTLQSGVDINAAAPLSTSNYNPLGSTPLYDAIGLSVASIEKTVKDLGVTKVWNNGGWGSHTVNGRKQNWAPHQTVKMVKDNPAIIADLLESQGYGPYEIKEYISMAGGIVDDDPPFGFGF
jgi:hypothetical protein